MRNKHTGSYIKLSLSNEMKFANLKHEVSCSKRNFNAGHEEICDVNRVRIKCNATKRYHQICNAPNNATNKIQLRNKRNGYSKY